MNRIKHENTTHGIKHWGLSGYSSFLPRIKFGVTGQASSPQSPNDFIPPSVSFNAGASLRNRNSKTEKGILY